MRSTVFLFGESKKGEFGTPFECRSLPELLSTVGDPPGESLGVHYAIQTLLYEKKLLFCRVQEEGFSTKDYIKGLNSLKSKYIKQNNQALFMPGVGDQEILDIAMEVCILSKSILVLTEKDLYDYLTHSTC